MDSFNVTALTGSYLFKINHSKTKDMDIGKCIISPKFSVGEYDWTVVYYPQGNKDDGRKYVSTFVNCKASENVSATFELALLDKNGYVSPTTLQKCSRTFPSGGKSWGWPAFLERTILEETYVKDGFFVLKVKITLKDESCRGACWDNSLPNKRIKKFREENRRTDVTFNVDGKTFVAHRLILAAHSPVFEAELLGTMAESNMDCIKINEMMSSVFKAMIDFMYTGSLPVAEELGDDEEAMPLTVFLQNLLVAADRYAVDKLKFMCEDKLIRSISLDNVLPLLELAEKHCCSDLKTYCLKFIVTKDNLLSVVLTEGCIKLLHNHPSLLAELKEMASK